MKKFISIFFLLTMLLQAIPVLHFFSEVPACFFVALDEEKPTEKSKELKEDKQDDKVFYSAYYAIHQHGAVEYLFSHFSSQLPASPRLEMLTPPPDFC